MDYDKLLCETKRRLALRNNEPELRTLSEKLHGEVVGKMQFCQIKEKEYAVLQEKIAASRESKIIQEKRFEDEKFHRQKCRENMKSKQHYGKELELQIKMDEATKKRENIIKELECQDLQEKLKILAEENKIYLEEKRKFIEELRYEMHIMQKAREAERKKNKLLMLEESRRIDQICQELEMQLKKQEEEHKVKLKLRECLNEKISKNLEEIKLAAEERKKLIEELREYDFKEKEKMQNGATESRKDFKTKEYRGVLEKQVEANLARQQALKHLGNQYAEQLLDEIKKQKQIDNIEKRQVKIKQTKYADDIKKQIKSNVNRCKEVEDLVKSTSEYINQYNAERDRQIEEEKRLMILEHKQKILMKK